MGREKKKAPKKDISNKEVVIGFINSFCESVRGHNTDWEMMISNLSDEELEKFARLWAPAVEYAMSRMEIYKIHERYD